MCVEELLKIFVNAKKKNGLQEFGINSPKIEKNKADFKSRAVLRVQA